ncbi:transposase [Mesorhizobium sp.]|uniref:transposase n=1 Tax=Mesorhizobium sp. TaxID=1871066 RepID=UPI0025F3D402|nr:transposase [Mesorhizobium sp.]
MPEIPTRLKAEPQPYTLNLGELRRRSNASSCSRQLYRELIGITPLAYLKQATERLAAASTPPIALLWQIQVRHYRPLIKRIVTQSERRVLAGEQVAASDKLVSLFEPDADIIVKGSRDTEYGHKLNLTTGRSGMILDLVIEAGNPRDSDRLLPMLDATLPSTGTCRGWRPLTGLCQSRQSGHSEDLGRSATWHSTRKTASGSRTMVRSNFRAGIEADISWLKRAYGLARCTWRSLDHFKTYVWSAVVAYNLVVFTRLKPTRR